MSHYSSQKIRFEVMPDTVKLVLPKIVPLFYPELRPEKI